MTLIVLLEPSLSCPGSSNGIFCIPRPPEPSTYLLIVSKYFDRSSSALDSALRSSSLYSSTTTAVYYPICGFRAASDSEVSPSHCHGSVYLSQLPALHLSHVQQIIVSTAIHPSTKRHRYALIAISLPSLPRCHLLHTCSICILMICRWGRARLQCVTTLLQYGYYSRPPSTDSLGSAPSRSNHKALPRFASLTDRCNTAQ